MDPLESVKEAIKSIRANLLRSLLTLLIIAVGITCLVGILTAIDSVLFSMRDNFNRLGANTFVVVPASEGVRGNRGGRQGKRAEPITYDQALEFKEKFKYSGATVSVEAYAASAATVKFKETKTNPNVVIRGIDESYLYTSAYELAGGRNITSTETNKIIIGSDINETLFNGNVEKALGNSISVNSDRYTVVGVLKSKGNSSGSSQDRRVFIPLMTAKSKYGYPKKNYNVSVAMQNAAMVDQATESAIGIMRNIRKLKAGKDNDFEFRKSDSILQQLKEMTSTLRWSTIIIAMLTLLGAAIGLMNIMLVTVTERTKEIGIRKALGATSNNVLLQFIVEAVVICLIGGVIGVVFGILIGFGVTLLVKGSFFIPWAWMFLGLVVCIVVGVLSGLYPALKASKLDPIESLRYE